MDWRKFYVGPSDVRRPAVTIPTLPRLHRCKALGLFGSTPRIPKGACDKWWAMGEHWNDAQRRHREQTCEGCEWMPKTTPVTEVGER